MNHWKHSVQVNHIKPITALIVTSLPILCVLAFGFKGYSLWYQVTDLWPNRLQAFLDDGWVYIHAPRYALTYPIFLLAEKLSIDFNAAFNIVIPLLFFDTTYTLYKVVSLRTCVPASMVGILIISAFVFVAYLGMNGRGTFLFLGYSAAMFSIFAICEQRAVPYWTIALMIGSIWLCSVSSGGLIVALSFSLVGLVVVFFDNEGRQLRQMRRRILLLGALLMAVFGYFVGLSLAATFRYFDDFRALLDHGVGRFFNGYLALGVVVLLVLGALSVVRRRELALDKLHVLAIVLPVVFGFFGFTTFSMVYIPLVVLVCSKIETTFSTGKSESVVSK